MPVNILPPPDESDPQPQYEFSCSFYFTIIGPFAAITPQLYKILADDYALVSRNLADAGENINNALLHITQISNVEAKLDIMNSIKHSNRQIGQGDLNKLLAAVRRLNNHVITRSHLSDINDFLVEGEIKVQQEWADLCLQTGVTINAENIV